MAGNLAWRGVRCQQSPWGASSELQPPPRGATGEMARAELVEGKLGESVGLMGRCSPEPAQAVPDSQQSVSEAASLGGGRDVGMGDSLRTLATSNGPGCYPSSGLPAALPGPLNPDMQPAVIPALGTPRTTALLRHLHSRSSHYSYTGTKVFSFPPAPGTPAPGGHEC